MSSEPRSRTAQNYPVLTVSTTHDHVPLVCDYRHSSSLQCSVTEMGYPVAAQSRHSSKFNPVDRLARAGNGALDISDGPPSGDSSGFEGSACLLDAIGRTDPSPGFSSSSSPGLESPSPSPSSAHIPGSVPISSKDAPCFDKSVALPSYSSNGRKHRSVPVENTIQKQYLAASSDRPRRQSSPGCSSSRSIDPRTTGLINSFNKMSLRARCRAAGAAQCAQDAHNRSLPSTAHPMSSLEPIPQGQELSVNTHLVSTHSATLSPGSSSPNPRQVAPHGDAMSVTDGGLSPVGSGGSGGSGSLEKRKLHPCCSCRAEDSSAFATPNARSLFTGTVTHSGETTAPAMSLKNGAALRIHDPHVVGSYPLDSSFPNPSDQPSRFDRHNQPTNIPGGHWAKELIGRLRSNSIHHHQPHSSAMSTDHSESLRAHHRRRRHSAPRDTDQFHRTMAHSNEPVRDPDSIDPRRLPKAHGPTSASLQFAKKPLQHPTTPLSPGAIPIPVAASPGQHAASVTSSSALKSSSWRPRKHIGKVRWLSQDAAEDTSSAGMESFSGSANSRLSCSAVEEFRGAVDILAVRCQPFATNNTNVRAGIRVKRASESERLLVISRSLSDSKEEFSTCSFGHFNEDHVYGTLFRHSTCYDVLPESGKLVVLDSKLGVVRAIRALLENGVQAAPIWHSATQCVTGLFSQDFALHLLSSLYHYESTTERETSATQGEPSDKDSSRTMPDDSSGPPKSQSVSMTRGLKIWGSRKLSDILRLFQSADHDHTSTQFSESALIVSPQMGLHKALCRLIHLSHSHDSQSHRSQTGSHHHLSDKISNSRLPGSVHNSKSISQDSADIFEWEPFPNASGAPSNDSKTSSIHSSQSGRRQRHSSDPFGGGASRGHSSTQSTESPSPRGPSTSSGAVTYSPTHLIVMNPDCGNVLGLLSVDRLLAYLRLRSDELPYSSQMMSPVGHLPGLRWTTRCAVEPNPTTVIPSNDSVSVTARLPNPVLSPQTPCHEALRTLDLWLPQIPSLPVIQSNNLLGFITSGDLLNFILGSSPDAAVDQPVSKILEGKMQHCRLQTDCVCYAQEPVATVLDRMFRLKVSYLLLFDTPTHCASSSPLPVGMVTAKDLLMSIVTVDHHHRHRHRSHNEQKQNDAGQTSEPMLVDDAREAEEHMDGDDDDDKSVDSCARALGLTRSQHERLQQTHSDMLLGLSHTSSFSLSSSVSSASGSTYSGACSDLEPEAEREPNTVEEESPCVGEPHRTHHHNHASSASTEKCNCACHAHWSSSPRRASGTPAAGIKPHDKSAHSHSMKPGVTGMQDKPGQQQQPTPLSCVDTFVESHSLKPSTWAQRHSSAPSGAMPPPAQPPVTLSSIVYTPKMPTIIGPATAMDPAFNARLRRSEAETHRKVSKRDEVDSVFRMD